MYDPMRRFWAEEKIFPILNALFLFRNHFLFRHRALSAIFHLVEGDA
jgi:hypothetical protein